MRGSATASRLLAAAALAAALLAPAPVRAQRGGDDDSAALVEQGRRDLRGRHYDAAARALDQAIQLNPRRIEAYVLRAAVHAAKKEYDKGIALLEKARALDDGNLDVLAALGSQELRGGDAERGEALLAQVVVADPHRYEVQELLGIRRAGEGEWADAIPSLEAYLADRPKELAGEDAYHQALLAEAYLRADRPRDAERLYRVVLAARPDEVAARMGRAWALAAIDCRTATEALDALDDLVDGHPEILLVRGECTLALGDAAGARQLGEQYLAASDAAKRPPSAQGYGLVGDAALAAGDLDGAREALARARDLEPTRRRWGLRLAVVLRRGGDADGAVAELERVGAPAQPADDLEWWHELGEALIAAGHPEQVEARYTQALAAAESDAELATIAGEAALRAGDAATAHAHLAAASALRAHDPRTEAWLVRAKAAVAAQLLAAGDLAGAEPVLASADQHAIDNDLPDAEVALDLGVVRLALDRAADAIAPLGRAASLAGAPAAYLALGQAFARTDDVGHARDAYHQAARAARGELAVMVAIDLASLELGAGKATDAIDALDAASAAAGGASTALAAQYQQASLAARHAAAVAALEAGSAGRAVTLLEAADKLAGGKDVAVRCDLALATVASGDRASARKRLDKLKKVTCPYPSPADTQAVPILLAFVEGLDPVNADRSLKTLAKLAGKTSGVTRRLLATVTRVVAMGAAAKAYDDGKLARARKLLATAHDAETRVGADEVALDLAVVDIADGKLDAAAAALDKLAPRLPEALVNLGVVADRQGDGAAALERWRAARKAGVKFAPLDDWIAAKERIFGKETP